MLGISCVSPSKAFPLPPSASWALPDLQLEMCLGLLGLEWHTASRAPFQSQGARTQ